MNKSFWPAVMAILLVAAVALIYFPVMQYEFVFYDDMHFVAQNPVVQSGLSAKSIKTACTSVFSGMWIPVTYVSFLLDHTLYGQNAGGYHLTNVILHAANALLLLAFLRLITGSLFPSALAAFLFAVHPLHVESVAWVIERKDVLSTFFGLISLLFYARYAGRHKLTAYFAALLSFAFSLLSKPMLVTLPFVFLLCDWWPMGRFSRNSVTGKYQSARLVMEKIPFFVLSAMASTITVLTMPKETLAAVPFIARLGNAIYAYAAYIAKTAWPSNLSILYPLPPAGPGSPKVMAALLLLTAISAVALKWGKRRPYLITGWLWYLGTLVPVIGLVQNGYQAMADRFTYVPLVGLFLMFSWGLPDLLRSFPRRQALLAIVSISIVLACTAVSSRQVRFWRNTFTLFERTAAVTQNNWRAHCVLAFALSEEGKTGEAMAHFRKALNICPDCREPLYGVGELLNQEGKTEEAMAHFREYQRICPDRWEPLNGMAEILAKEGNVAESIEYYQAALHKGGEIALLHVNLAKQLTKAGRTDEALGHFERAVMLEPESMAARQNLGEALLTAGRYQEALSEFGWILQKDPGSFQALDNKGTALAALGKANEAEAAFEQALSLAPDFTAAHYNLASLFARTGRFAQAVPHFEAALRLEPGHAKARLNLGNTLLFMEKKEEAMDQYRQALVIKPDFLEAHKNLGILLAGSGKVDEAALHLEEVMRANPNDQAASNILEKLNRTGSQNNRP
jgi:tetratricopeptide (TPR) repeat protein